MRYILSAVLIILLSSYLNVTAHEKHKKHIEQTAVKDTVQQMVDSSMIGHGKTVSTPVEDIKEEPFILNYMEEVFHHFHNKLVHFPIALTFIAFLFTLLSFKWEKFEFSIKYIVWAAAIFSIPTVITGLMQAGNFIGDQKEWVVAIHRILGISSMSIIWIWSIFLFLKPLRRFAWIISIVSFILTTVTGFYGGIVSH